jgi:hypothetical protein
MIVGTGMKIVLRNGIFRCGIEVDTQPNPGRRTGMKAIITSTALLALLAGPAVAQQPNTATGQVCLKSATALNCAYQTMAQCEQARPSGSSDQCVTRPTPDSTVGGASSEQRQPAPAPDDQKD